MIATQNGLCLEQLSETFDTLLCFILYELENEKDKNEKEFCFQFSTNLFLKDTN